MADRTIPFFNRVKEQDKRIKNLLNPQKIDTNAPFNKELYKKAYLLEFRKNGSIMEAFSFSVPPESEDFTYTYRTGETKTFGGSCIDFYGHDLYKISLSGSTINQEIKTVYRANQSTEMLSGEEEIFVLQGLLEKYAKQSLTNKTELILYDLSKNKATLKNNKNYVIGCYTVYPTDFKIKRSKDKPFTFNYSIDFLATPRTPDWTLPVDQTTTTTTQTAWYEDFFETYDLLKLGFNETLGMMNACMGDIEDLANQTLKALEVPANVVNSMLDSAKNMVTTARSIESRAKLTAYKYSFGRTYRNYSNNSVNEAETTDNEQETPLNQTGTVESMFSLQEAAENIDNILSELRDIQKNIEKANSELRALSIQINKPIDLIMKESQLTYFDMLALINKIYASIIKDPIELVETRDINGNIAIIKTYGYNVITWKEGDTLNHIAFSLYGDENYAYMLMQYNGIQSEEDIKLGQKLRCPKLVQTSNVECTEIYSLYEKNYGSDISLDVDGYILVNNGDIATISGQDNLNQAVVTRLTSFVNTNLKALTVGIVDAVGDSDTVSSFIVESVKQTLQDEPRISTVNQIAFFGQGNRLEISVSYSDIASQENSITTVI